MLAEGGPIRSVVELLAALPDHTVLCSHGDILMGTIDAADPAAVWNVEARPTTARAPRG